eukprot:8598141-Pyramimonas_sp.AAC.1
MVAKAWVKSSENMTCPHPWACHLAQLDRTTADCIFEGLCRTLPLWPFRRDSGRGFPLPSAAQWVILVFVVDDATSNRRFWAWFEANALRFRRFDDTNDLINKMFRAGHVMSAGANWSLMIHKMTQYVESKLNV